MTQPEKRRFDTPDWATLAQSIGDGEAILLLGPDAVPMYRVDNKDGADELPQSLTFSQLTRLKIKHNKKVKYAFHYQRALMTPNAITAPSNNFFIVFLKFYLFSCL